MRIWRTINRLINATILLVLLPWFAYFAYVRATTPPRGVTIEPDTEERHRAGVRMRAAVTSIPAFKYTPTGSRGWPDPTYLMSQALGGEWDVQSRRLIAAVSAHVARVDVNEALDTLAALAETPFAVGGGDLPWTANQAPGDGQQAVLSYELTLPAATLLGRARARQAERNDAAGAVGDVVAAMRVLGPGGADSLRGYWYYRDYLSPVSEAAHLAYEAALDRASAARLSGALRTHASQSVGDELLRTLTLADWRREVDRCYTLADDGDGWLAVNTLPCTFFGAGRRGPRGSAWNIGSPLFRGRRAITAKLSEMERILKTLDAQEAETALPLVAGLRLFDVRDGPFFMRSTWYGDAAAEAEQAYRRVHTARAAIIMCGLSAYRSEHGAYPETLDALSPEYLAEVPISLITQKPFSFVRMTDSRYSLSPFAVDADQPEARSGGLRTRLGDLQFPKERIHVDDP